MEQLIRPHADLVEADLRCLMCARVLGRLATVVRRGPGAHCGGMAVVDEISVSAVRDEPLAGPACPIHHERVHGRGGRPKGCQSGVMRSAPEVDARRA